MRGVGPAVRTLAATVPALEVPAVTQLFGDILLDIADQECFEETFEDKAGSDCESTGTFVTGCLEFSGHGGGREEGEDTANSMGGTDARTSSRAPSPGGTYEWTWVGGFKLSHLEHQYRYFNFIRTTTLLPFLRILFGIIIIALHARYYIDLRETTESSFFALRTAMSLLFVLSIVGGTQAIQMIRGNNAFDTWPHDGYFWVGLGHWALGRGGEGRGGAGPGRAGRRSLTFNTTTSIYCLC